MGKSGDCSRLQERIREGNLWYCYVCLSHNLNLSLPEKWKDASIDGKVFPTEAERKSSQMQMASYNANVHADGALMEVSVKGRASEVHLGV